MTLSLITVQRLAASSSSSEPSAPAVPAGRCSSPRATFAWPRRCGGSARRVMSRRWRRGGAGGHPRARRAPRLGAGLGLELGLGSELVAGAS
eukprot:scaffold15100_cov61-Phaeocystis_antarctica.AAC.8